MEDHAPVAEVNAAGGITQDVEATEGGTSARHHDFRMGFPTEFLVDEHAKVTHRCRSPNRKSPAAGNPEVKGGT